MTHVSARVAVGGNVALTTAELNAGVFVGIAPGGPGVRRNRVDGNSAAWDGQRAVLRGGKAGKGRGGNDDCGVEHGGEGREYRCLENVVLA